MLRQFELVERVRSYDAGVDEAALNSAYVFAMVKHGSQTRDSGDPYFSHPVEAAGILADMKLDSQSIITGLLHDTVEDTNTTLDEISGKFGPQIANLVDGVTKLSRLESQAEEGRRTMGNYAKLFLAMSEDLRVLLVKLADRLHNMRTLQHVRREDKRLRIARETMEIYVPMAERIGMQWLKEELEDLAFSHINEDARNSILERLRFLRPDSNLAKIERHLKRVLKKGGLDARVDGREKKPHAIWRKMQRKNVSFDQLSDIVAFRVVVSRVPDCYAALGVIHGVLPMIPDRFKDYISTPKPNGYRSIHTTVHGPEGKRLEIQIRTREMDEVAEYGVAAHWSYTAGEDRASASDGSQYQWVRQLLDSIDSTSDPEEFIKNTKLQLFQDRVYCFTPMGEIHELPRNATPVDFAYAIHTRIGDTCVGAKINGVSKRLDTILQNGDQVEIMRSRYASPNPLWVRFVVTGRAHSRIRRHIRIKERGEYIRLGRAIIQQTCASLRRVADDDLLEKFSEAFGKRTVDDLLEAVGRGEITSERVRRLLTSKRSPSRKRRRFQSSGKHAVSIDGLTPGMAVHHAECCHPLPGDRIVGIVETGKGVAIHTIDCDSLQEHEDSVEEWLDVSWSPDGAAPEHYVGRIAVDVINQPGALGEITTAIGNQDANITNLKINARTADFFGMLIDLEVHDVHHLTSIIAALRSIAIVMDISRAP